MISTLEKDMIEYGVQIKPHGRFLRLLGKVMFWNPDFNKRFWVTIARTIYYPDKVREPLDYPTTLRHEMVHVKQWDSMGFFLWVIYADFIFGRWWVERTAYLENIPKWAPPSSVAMAIEDIIYSLKRSYLILWPRSWMRKWFMKQVGL